MKKIIDGIVFNTETAELIAHNWNGSNRKGLQFFNKEIYKTKNGEYFLFCECDNDELNYRWRSCGNIKPLKKSEVFEILQDWDEVNLIISLFP